MRPGDVKRIRVPFGRGYEFMAAIWNPVIKSSGRPRFEKCGNGKAVYIRHLSRADHTALIGFWRWPKKGSA